MSSETRASWFPVSWLTEKAQESLDASPAGRAGTGSKALSPFPSHSLTWGFSAVFQMEPYVLSNTCFQALSLRFKTKNQKRVYVTLRKYIYSLKLFGCLKLWELPTEESSFHRISGVSELQRFGSSIYTYLAHALIYYSCLPNFKKFLLLNILLPMLFTA